MNIQEKLITQLIQRKLTIENDSMLAVICSFGYKTNKAIIKATKKLYRIIENEFKQDKINYNEIDIKIKASEIIGLYLKRAA
jgi:hypothetical protein